jgi:hypothetical protein
MKKIPKPFNKKNLELVKDSWKKLEDYSGIKQAFPNAQFFDLGDHYNIQVLKPAQRNLENTLENKSLYLVKRKGEGYYGMSHYSIFRDPKKKTLRIYLHLDKSHRKFKKAVINDITVEIYNMNLSPLSQLANGWIDFTNDLEERYFLEQTVIMEILNDFDEIQRLRNDPTIRNINGKTWKEFYRLLKDAEYKALFKVIDRTEAYRVLGLK